MKETDITAVSISHDKQVIAAGDLLGRLKLYYYPAINQNQSCAKIETGHATGVSSVLFTPFHGLRQS